MLNYAEFIAQRIFHATGENLSPILIRQYLAAYSFRLDCRCLSGNLQRGDARRIILTDHPSVVHHPAQHAPKSWILFANLKSFLADPLGACESQADRIAARVLTVEELYNWYFHLAKKDFDWERDLGCNMAGVRAEVLQARTAVIEAKLARAGYNDPEPV